MALPQVGLEAVIENMAGFNKSVATINKSYDSINTGAKDVQQTTGSLGTSISGLGSKMIKFGTIAAGAALAGVAALSAGLIALGVSSVKAGAEFTKTMSNVGAISGATAEEFDQLTASAQDLGATTKFTATEAAEGMTFLAQAGFEVNDIIGAMPDTLDLAAASGAGLGEAADIVSNILSGFNAEASETSKFTDILTATFTSSNVTLTDLGEGMKFVAPIAASLGVDVADLSGAMGILGNAGIQGGEGGTALRAALLRLSSPAGEAADMMHQLGINVFDAGGNLKSLPDVLEQVQNATKGMTQEQRVQTLETIFGMRNVSAFSVLLEAGADTLRGYGNELRDSVGITSEIASKQLDNLSGDVTLFQSAISGIKIKIFRALEPLLRDIVKTGTELSAIVGPLLAGVFDKIAQVITNLIATGRELFSIFQAEGISGLVEALGLTPATTELIKKITQSIKEIVEVIIGLFIPALGDLTTSGFLDTLNAAIEFVNENFEAFKGAILAVAAVLGGAAIVAAIAAIGSALAALISPIGLIVVAVAALGAAWNSNFLGIRDIVQDFWKDFRPILNNIFKWLKKNIPAALKALQKAFKPILDKVLPELLDLFNIILKWVKKNWPLIKKIIISTLDSLINAFKIFVKVVGAFWDKWGDDIIKITSFVFGTIFKIIKTNLKNILDFISAILKLITGDWKGAWEDITKITDRTMDTIRDIIEDGFNAFRSVISKIMGNILNIINNIWDDIERAIDDAIDDIVDTVRDGFNKLPSIISDMTSKMKNAAQAMMNGVINGITSKLSEIRNALTNTVSSAISSLLSDVTGGGISSMLRSIGQNIIGKIVDGINAVGNFASSLISKINSELQKLLGEAWNAAKTIGSNIVQRILDGISSFTGFVSSVRNKIGSWIQDIVNNLSSIGSAAFQVGREIVQRMLDGIGSMASKFIDWVRDKFNDWMGSIFSPIPAARHMGEQIVENVMDGIGQQENSFVSVLRNSLSDWIAQASAGAMIAITPELVGANALLSNITTPLAVTPTLGAGGQTIINNNTFQVGGNTLNSQMDMAQFEAQVLNVIRRNL